MGDLGQIVRLVLFMVDKVTSETLTLRPGMGYPERNTNSRMFETLGYRVQSRWSRLRDQVSIMPCTAPFPSNMVLGTMAMHRSTFPARRELPKLPHKKEFHALSIYLI